VEVRGSARAEGVRPPVERIGQRFKESIARLTNGFEAFAVWLVGGLPVIFVNLLIFAAIILAIWLIVRIIKRRLAKRRAKFAASRADGPTSVFLSQQNQNPFAQNPPTPPQSGNPPEPPKE
jgi:predicted lipid-binding transport protein (Tim44 family)